MDKQITIIYSIWLFSFIVSLAFYFFKDSDNYFNLYILKSMAMSKKIKNNFIRYSE